MSRTCWAPPHISAQSATVARSSTRDNGGQPPCFAPRSDAAGTATLSSLTSHSLRVSSIVGNSVTAKPAASFGTRNRLTPSSIVVPSRVRTATTSASLKCASATKSLVPERTNPPAVSRPVATMPAASQRALGSVQARLTLAEPAAMRGSHSCCWACEPTSRIAAAEQHGRKERPGHDRPAHFLHQYCHFDEAEPAAARLLGEEDAEPTLIGQLLPENVGHRRRLRHAVADKGRGTFVFEEPSGARAQQLLLFGKADIHITGRGCTGGSRTAPCRGNAAAYAASRVYRRPYAIRRRSAPRARQNGRVQRNAGWHHCRGSGGRIRCRARRRGPGRAPCCTTR